MQEESDSRAVAVLERALSSTNRVTRLRAVAMLARFSCTQRADWLERALADIDAGVRDTAEAVISWTLEPRASAWPQREDPRFDRVAQLREPESDLRGGPAAGHQWEYVVEIWREDGLLVGAFLASTCEEDDEHARRIALGQAILASVGPGGDAFEPRSAAAFIVAKRRASRTPRPPWLPRSLGG